MATEEIFADRMESLAFSGGVVRCEFVSLESDENGKTLHGKTVSIALSPSGLLKAWTMMNDFTGRLVENGILVETGGASSSGSGVKAGKTLFAKSGAEKTFAPRKALKKKQKKNAR